MFATSARVTRFAHLLISRQGRCLAAVGLLLAGATLASAQAVPRHWDFDPAQVLGFKEGPQRDDVAPGEFFIDPPTLENLGFRWYIEGDSNRNATVDVDFRKHGETAWQPALPMFRSHHEIVQRYQFRDTYNHYRTGNLFAGSVMFLTPGTTYEVRFTMSDPDGGAPGEAKVVTVATRGEPAAWDGGRTLHVYPPQFEGQREDELAFDGIATAYAQAQPGDIILLHPGVHPANDAPYLLTKSGEPGKPIVFRGAGAKQTIIEGPNLETDLFRVPGASHLLFEDLAMRQCHTAIHAAPDRAAGAHPYDRGGPGASWLTVRRCHIENVINGIWTYSANSRNWLIADNIITGTNEVWYPRRTPERGYMDGSHTGVNVYGQGHVVCYNRISRFSDSLAIANFSHPDATDLPRHAVNIDFYGNDLSFATDDTLEADYGCHNVRVYQNLLYNTHTALSVQPAYGGPIYLIRNVAFGITTLNLKWNNQAAGIVAYHNTLLNGGGAFNSPYWSNSHLRNNLLLGNGRMISAGTFTPERTTMDYNGYRGNTIRWSRDGREERVEYPSLAAFNEATGYEAHGIHVDFDIFLNASPVQRGTTYAPEDVDLRLKSDSAAVDVGIRLPNVNDDYTGAAPDLGAIETDGPRPHYGPRS